MEGSAVRQSSWLTIFPSSPTVATEKPPKAAHRTRESQGSIHWLRPVDSRRATGHRWEQACVVFRGSPSCSVLYQRRKTFLSPSLPCFLSFTRIVVVSFSRMENIGRSREGSG